MTVEELDKLRSMAQKQLGVKVWFRRHDDCWVTGTTGNHETKLHKTFEAMIERLEEWAAPPRPATVTITVPFSDAVKMVGVVGFGGMWESFETECQKAIAPYMPLK